MTNTERQHAYRDAINEYNSQAIGQPDPMTVAHAFRDCVCAIQKILDAEEAVDPADTATTEVPQFPA